MATSLTRLATGPSDAIGGCSSTVEIGTVRNVDVAVTIIVLEWEPKFDADRFEQSFECSIVVEIGAIVVAGCADYFTDAARINIPSGPSRVRASFEGLESVSADGVEGNDEYQLLLWPAPTGTVEILTQST